MEGTTGSTEENNNKKDGLEDAETKDELCTEITFGRYEFGYNPSAETLEEWYKELSVAIDYMIKNDFRSAYNHVKQYKGKSFIHNLTLLALNACIAGLSLEENDLQDVHEIGKKAYDEVCQIRKSTSFFTKTNANDYTDEECHTELVYAEANGAFGLLVPLHDRSITGFLKAGIKIKICHQSYKECKRILEEKTNWKSEFVRNEFECGVNLGLGLFELTISFIPSKMIRILEFIGFSGNRICGLNSIKKAASIKKSLRHHASVIFLGVFNFFLEYFYGLGEADIALVEGFITDFETKDVKSAFIWMGKAISNQLQGRPEKALECFDEFLNQPGIFRPVRYASTWNIMWCHGMLSDWGNAAKSAKHLMDKCRWSRALFAYLYGCFLSLEMQECNKPELEEEVFEVFKNVPKLKKTLGGKKVFHEKLVIEKSNGFCKNSDSLILAPLEMFYVYNVFNMMEETPRLLHSMMDLIEKYSKDEKNTKSKDNYYYLIFLKGVCYSHLNCPFQATECFLDVINSKDKLKHSTHLAPQSSFEIGLIHRKIKDFKEAKKWFKKTHNNYSGYLTESMINFRIGYALDSMVDEIEETELLN